MEGRDGSDPRPQGFVWARGQLTVSSDNNHEPERQTEGVNPLKL